MNPFDAGNGVYCALSNEYYMSILARNNVKIEGKGTQPMLFAHGFGCDQYMWRLTTPAFEDNYKIITFDYVGHGKSDLTAYNPERYSSLRGYAQDVLDIIKELDLQNVVFVGHSVSSIVGLLAAVKNPAVFSSLIMLCPSPCYINDQDYHGGFERAEIIELLETMEKNYTGWANFLGPIIMGNPERPELTTELVESFCSTDPSVARQFAEVTFLSDNRSDLKNTNTPSLILQCTDDIIAPVSVGSYVAANIPRSTFVQMEATGHCPHMSHPEETIIKMKEYLGVAS